MDQELVPDQDMPSDDSFEQAVRDEGDVADTAATEIKTARSKESKKTGGENMECPCRRRALGESSSSP